MRQQAGILQLAACVFIRIGNYIWIFQQSKFRDDSRNLLSSR